MPLTNVHAARIKDPKKFKSIRTKKNEFGPGIDIQYGALPTGGTEVQSIHFDSNKFTPDKAKKWLKDHSYVTILFEPALDSFKFTKKETLDTGRFSFTLTKEGYLRGVAAVTRTGIFDYNGLNGKNKRVLRHPDEVFKKESLDSLKMIPITNGHPSDKNPNVDPLLASDSVNKFIVGFTGENIQPDGAFVKIPFCIFDKETIEDAENGRIEISCGYDAEYYEIPGVYNDESYDFIQTNIMYNHLATVNTGRAGPSVRLPVTDGQSTKKGDSYMPIITIDGIDYESSPEVSRSHARLVTEAINAAKTIKDLQDKIDKNTITLDSMNKELSAIKAIDNNKAIEDGVRARFDLEKQVFSVLDSKTDISKLNGNEIKRLVVSKMLPDIKCETMVGETLDAMFSVSLGIANGKRVDEEDDGEVDNDDDDGAVPLNLQKKAVLDNGGSGTKPRTAVTAYDEYKKRLILGHLTK